MKAIITEYKGPTLTGPARIIAKNGDGPRVTLTYGEFVEGESVGEPNHDKAARKFAEKMGWHGKVVRNWLRTGSYVYCWIKSGMHEEKPFVIGNCPDCEEAEQDPDAPYHATPCGTHCEDCMAEHVKECGVCASQFPELVEDEEEEEDEAA